MMDYSKDMRLNGQRYGSMTETHLRNAINWTRNYRLDNPDDYWVCQQFIERLQKELRDREHIHRLFMRLREYITKGGETTVATKKTVKKAVNKLFPGQPNYKGPNRGFFTFVHHQALVEYSSNIAARVHHIKTCKPSEERSVRLSHLMYLCPRTTRLESQPDRNVLIRLLMARNIKGLSLKAGGNALKFPYDR